MMTPDTKTETSSRSLSREYPHGWVTHPETGRRLKLLEDARVEQRFYGNDAVDVYEADAIDAEPDEDGDLLKYLVVWQTTPEWDAACERLEQLRTKRYDTETMMDTETMTEAELAQLEDNIASGDESEACDWDVYEVEDA